MKNTLYTTVALLTSLAFSSAADAAIVNSGFEEDFDGWDTIGDFRIENSSFGSGPIEGDSQAFLSTAFNETIGLDENFNEIIGGNAACVTFISGVCEDSLEAFFNVSIFQGDTFLDSIATGLPIEGSAVKQTFTARAGQILSFSWNFLTNESVEHAAVDDFTYPDFNDFAFVSIQSDTSGDQLFSIADTISDFRNSSNQFFDNETGFGTFSYILPTNGEYTLGIGVVDVGEPTRISGLLVDRVAVVPETSSTLGLLFLGALGTVSIIKGVREKRFY